MKDIGFAQSAFTTADRYERGRSGYPDEAVAWLTSVLGVDRGSTVVDLAAGTGKFTRLLVPGAGRVVAIEPVAAMRDELARVVTGSRVVGATAEALPLATGSVDAITVAQAFHWFDASVALPEMRRVLRPGGRLGLIWNRADTSVPWVARLDALRSPKKGSLSEGAARPGAADYLRAGKRQAARLRRRLGGPAKVPTAGGDPWWVARCREGFASSAVFAPLESRVFRHREEMDVDRLADWVASFSRFSKLSAADQAAVLGRVRTLAARELPPLFEFPYRTDVFWTTAR